MFFESEDNPLKPGGGSLSSTADPFGINRRRRPSLLDLDLPPTENNRGLLWDPADGFAKGPQPSQAFGPPKLPTLTGLDDDNDPNQTAGGLNRGGDPGRGDAALTQLASPFGPSDGADPWAAGSMADVLLRKDDYADAATHYQGQAKTDPAGTRAELSAIHDRMASADPASAAKFVTQMSAAGLTAAKTEPPAEVGLTPLWIDIYNTHQEDDSFDPKDSDTIEVADASERTNAPFVAKARPDEIIQRAKANGGWLSTGGDTAINGGWNAQGRYPSNDTGNHAAIFAGWDCDKNGTVIGMKVLDQWAERRKTDGTLKRPAKEASVRTIPLDEARKYSVITRE
jgi:hypothetical protein